MGNLTQEQYAGGTRGGLAGLYAKQAGQNPYQAKPDQYYGDWAAEQKKNQLADRQQLTDLYGQLQQQAAGGMTPQRAQMMAQQQQAGQLQGQLANSAAGGAYAQSAARGAFMQNQGVQGAQNTQQQNQMKASDMIQAQGRMMQVASQQRAMDLQSQGMTMEDAFRQAQAEARARGLNIDRSVGYGALEAGAMGNDYAMYQDAQQRWAKEAMEKEARNQLDAGRFAQTVGTAAAGAAAFL